LIFDLAKYGESMPFIKLQVKINTDKDKIYALLKAPDKYPAFMKDVKNVALLNEPGGVVRAEWQVEIDGVVVIWKEKRICQDETGKVFFRLTEGDFEEFFGSWSIEEEKDACLLTLEASINWGAPNLSKFVGPMVLKKVTRGLQSMLLAIKRKSEADA